MVKDKPAKTAKHAGGRPTKYRSEYCKQIIDYIDYGEEQFFDVSASSHTNRRGETWSDEKRIPKPLRFVGRWAQIIGVNTDTLAEWCRVHPEFSAAYARARQIQAEHILQCGFAGLSDANISKFAAVNMTDLSDKTETKHSGAILLLPPEIK